MDEPASRKLTDSGHLVAWVDERVVSNDRDCHTELSMMLTIHLNDGVGDFDAFVCAGRSKHVRMTGPGRVHQERTPPVLDAIARDIWESLLEAVVLAGWVHCGRSVDEACPWKVRMDEGVDAALSVLAAARESVCWSMKWRESN